MQYGRDGRNEVIVKVARLLLLLRGRTRTPDLEWLAMHMECSTRTVHRYLASLEAAGWVRPEEQAGLEQA